MLKLKTNAEWLLEIADRVPPDVLANILNHAGATDYPDKYMLVDLWRGIAAVGDDYSAIINVLLDIDSGSQFFNYVALTRGYDG